LCEEIDAEVVISSTWRLGKTIDELQEIIWFDMNYSYHEYVRLYDQGYYEI
jgi:hypothetical protein